MMYHYLDLTNNKAIVSSVPIHSNGVQLLGIVEQPSVGDATDAAALALVELPMLIGKKQMAAMNADHAAMWRYFNNAQVARLMLAGDAPERVAVEFRALLSANQAEHPDFYGTMDTLAFAQFILKLNEDFMVLGLKLETERITRRTALNASAISA